MEGSLDWQSLRVAYAKVDETLGSLAVYYSLIGTSKIMYTMGLAERSFVGGLKGSSTITSLQVEQYKLEFSPRINFRTNQKGV